MPDILTAIRARPAVSRLRLGCILLCTAAAAWLSQATIASTGVGDARLALLPVSVVALAICAAAAAGVFAAWRAGASLVPVSLLVLVALPWLPKSTPAAFLMWSGPLALAVWGAVALALWSSTPVWRGLGAGRLRDTVTSHPRLTAAALACAVYAVAAWQVAPSVPGGDEPHYLIITQSLLEDGDLKIENNHRAGDYRAYFAGDLSKPDYRRRGRNGEIYSIHAPGLPVIVAPAFALGGYYGVVVFLVLLASAGSALAWHLAWLVTRSRGAAWFGWAAVTFSTSAIFHSFTVYPDGPGGVIVLTGIWALLRAEQDTRNGDERMAPWLWHGAALALLPWIHTRFALLAGSLGALVLLRLSTNRNPAGKAVAFLSIPAVSALCWVGFFVAVYGTPDPSVPYANEEGSAAFIPGGLAGLFFDQRFGLLAYAPVLICAFAGVGWMAADRARRRLGLELLFVLVPYLLAVTHFAMWWGGTSAPARFFVPMLPMLAIPAAVAWTAIRHRATRASALAALAATVFVSAALMFVDGGRLAYNVRQSYAVWLEWLNGGTELSRGLPAWWRGSEALFYRDIAIWVGAMGSAWAALRAVEGTRWLRSRGAFGAATAAAYAIALMCAVTTVWALAGVRGAADTPGQLELLRRIGAERRALLLALPAFQRVAPQDVPPMLRIQPVPSVGLGGAGQNDRPLYQIASVPAGRYRLAPRGSEASGWLMVGIGRDQFSLASGPLSAPPDPVILDFPVDVRAIVVRGDEQARRSVQGVTIEPLAIVMPADRIAAGTARRAVRYGTATVFFLDERSFPEPEAFWVGGNRTATMVLRPDTPGAALSLLVRNGPVQNQAVLRAGQWGADISLAPGEERQIALPLETRRAAVLLSITAAAGFRPSDIDSNSRDTRFLGVWVRVD
jgi:hypothetical protein